MLFRQLMDLRSSTYTYLLADERTREAVLIDPVFELFQRDAALLRELSLKLLFTLETHVHADHVTAAWLFRERLGSRIVVGESATEGADRVVREGDVIRFGAYALKVLATPGHTKSCVSYVFDDRLVFTGDALMVRSAGRTDFQEGSAHRLYEAVHEKLFRLPDDCQVYPAHDYAGRMSTTIGEERAYNPRLGGQRNEADFVAFMDNLGLPHPKQMEVAVPANMRCGRPTDTTKFEGLEPEWAPARRSFGGILEVEPEWVGDHLSEVQILDVREPDEWAGELGQIPGSLRVPLGELRARSGELPRNRPIVAVCRAGGRSAEASVILEKAGFTPVASMSGGMIRWHSLRLPVELGSASRGAH